MGRWRLLFMLVVLTALLPSVNAASFVRNLSMADGLSQNSALSIVQDQRGYLWIGSRDGLNRYDGKHVKIFRERPNDPLTVYGQTINALALAEKGQIWVGSDRGLSLFDPRTETFQRIRCETQKKPLADLAIFDLIKRRNGEIWLATMRGVFRYDATQQCLQAIADINETAFALAETPTGQLWIGLRDRLLQYDDHQQQFSSIPLDVSVAAYGGLRRLLAVSDQYLWLSGWQSGISRLHIASKTIEHRRLRQQEDRDGDFVHSLVADNAQRLWLGTRMNGLFVLNQRDTAKLSQPEHSMLIHDHTISSLWLDSDQQLWAGTDRDGVHLLSLRPSRFSSFYNSDAAAQRWRDDDVRSLYSDTDHVIWAGTANGLHRIDRRQNTVNYFPLPLASKKELRADAIHALAPRRDGGFWLGTEAGLYRYDPQRERIVSMHTAVPDLPIDRQHAIVTLYEDRNAELWLGTFGSGVLRLSANGKLQRLPSRNDHDASVRGQFIFALLHDRQQRLWIGHENGIDIYDDAKQHFIALSTDGEATQRLSHPAIQSLLLDRDGDVWIGTLLGLNRWSARSNSIRHYFVSHGLPNNTVYALLQDQQGQIWCSTNNGLARIDPVSERIDVFDRRHGIHNSEFNGGSSLALHNGELLFGGVDGFTVFNPAKLAQRTQGPRLALTSLKIQDQERLLQPVLDQREALQLSFRDTMIRIDIAALEFSQPDNQRFAYKLEPIDQNWVDIGNQSFITLRNLPADQYTLRMHALNADGVAGEERTLRLEITPPWWANAMAYTFYAITLITIVVATVRWRIRRLQQRTRELEATVQQRTQQISTQNETLNSQTQRLNELLQRRDQLFANVSHEFRTPLTLITSPTEVLLQHTTEPQHRQWLLTIQRNSARLLRMVDQLLDLSRLQSGAPLAIHAQPLSTIAQQLVIAFGSVAQKHSLQFDHAIAPDLWVKSQADALEQILINLLSNAFKFTPAGGTITFTIAAHDNNAIISVRDTGRGIPAAHHADIFERFYRVEQQHTETIPGAGLGLAVVREWVQSLGGHLQLQSEVGHGTEFIVQLPLCERDDRIVATNKAIVIDDTTIDDTTSAQKAAINDASSSLPLLLIVEDNAELRGHLCDLLATEYQCITAADGESGLALAIEHVPDLILCDVAMPIMDGFEMARRVRHDERSSHIPFVFLTAYGDKDSRLQGLRELADDYIAKPFDNDELKQRLRNLLSLRKLLQQRYRQRSANDNVTLPELSERDERLLQRLRQLFDSHAAEADFDITQMAQLMAMSERQLQRKVQALLDMTPTEYLKVYRLQRAAQLLQKGRPAGQVAIEVGFSSQAYFTRCFKAHFGVAPGQYRQQ